MKKYCYKRLIQTSFSNFSFHISLPFHFLMVHVHCSIFMFHVFIFPCWFRPWCITYSFRQWCCQQLPPCADANVTAQCGTALLSPGCLTVPVVCGQISLSTETPSVSHRCSSTALATHHRSTQTPTSPRIIYLLYSGRPMESSNLTSQRSLAARG